MKPGLRKGGWIAVFKTAGQPEFPTIFLEQDPPAGGAATKTAWLKLPKGAGAGTAELSFMLLDKGGAVEVGELLEQCGIRPQVHFTTWDDYAIMSMVESGLGIAMSCPG